MARINIPPIHVSREECREQINKQFRGAEKGERNLTSAEKDRRNHAFLVAIFKSFQNKMMKYYKAGGDTEERFQRLEEIRQMLTEIGFTDGKDIFTIAPTINSIGRKKCPKGEVCICGVCERVD